MTILLPPGIKGLTPLLRSIQENFIHHSLTIANSSVIVLWGHPFPTYARKGGGGFKQKRMFVHEGGGGLGGRTKAYVRKIKKLQISFSIDWQNYLRFLLLSLFHRSLFPFHLSPNSLRNFTNIFHVSYTLILQLFLYGS